MKKSKYIFLSVLITFFFFPSFVFAEWYSAVNLDKTPILDYGYGELDPLKHWDFNVISDPICEDCLGLDERYNSEYYPWEEGNPWTSLGFYLYILSDTYQNGGIYTAKRLDNFNFSNLNSLDYFIELGYGDNFNGDTTNIEYNIIFDFAGDQVNVFNSYGTPEGLGTIWTDIAGTIDLTNFNNSGEFSIILEITGIDDLNTVNPSSSSVLLDVWGIQTLSIDGISLLTEDNFPHLEEETETPILLGNISAFTPNSENNVVANVSGALTGNFGSLLKVGGLIIATFLSFYLLNKIMGMFPNSKKKKGRKGRKKKKTKKEKKPKKTKDETGYLGWKNRSSWLVSMHLDNTSLKVKRKAQSIAKQPESIHRDKDLFLLAMRETKIKNEKEFYPDQIDWKAIAKWYKNV